LRIVIALLLALCLVDAPGNAIGKSRLLQTVDVPGWSTEGGEARLRLVTGPKRSFCSIDAAIYGEGGRNEYEFAFRKGLLAATKREYLYSVPYYEAPNFKTRLAKTTTLKSSAGSQSLRKDFADFKALFRKGALAECTGL
jgi:hypothetical protein